MNFKIEFSSKAYKYLNKMDSLTKNRINTHLIALSENPRRHQELDIKKLQGNNSLYRLRVGNYRILYTIENNILLIFIVRISPRGDAYDKVT